MTTFIEHPDAAVLQAYLHGRLPLEQAMLLDSHLESCEDCGRKLATVGSDTYSDLLRLPATQAFTNSMEMVRPDLPAELRAHSRYQIQDLIGRGGMGVVYRAVHRMMSRPVALKIIRPEFLASPEAVERFKREVRAAAQLSHPNIVAAHDAEEVGGVHFLVMEFVDGKTLDAIVRKRGPLPVATACQIARQVAMGLDHAHSRGMVHRDIKPLNLILADKSRVKILDFGLAIRRDPNDDTEPTTREGQMLGTLIYAAPEQRKSAATVDARADLYSLGATLAFLLLGDQPLCAPNWPETIPAGLRAILTKLMAHSPDDRYPTAKSVAEALVPWCGTRTMAVEPMKAAEETIVEAVLIEEKKRPPIRAVSAVRSKSRKLQYAAALLVPFLVIAGLWMLTRNRPDEPTLPTTPSPNPVPAPSPVKWASLLNFDPARHAVAGQWRMENGELRVNAEEHARIAIPAAVPAEYDLRVEFTRRTGDASIGAIVVQNDFRTVFELDAWGEHLGGFQDVGGRTLRDNPTRRNNVRLINGTRYTMLVEVRRGSIRGELNGREIARHLTNGSDLSINEWAWRMPHGTGLGLVAWKSETTFHTVDLASR